jgi:hypothetical protein
MSFHSSFLGSCARAGLAAVLVLTVFAPTVAAADSPTSPFPGLELVNSKNVDRLYRRPEVDLSAYDKVIIGEPAVDFSKNWNPRNYGTFGLSAAQVTKIRTDLAAMAKSTFAKVLGEGGYAVVTAAGDGVLQITPNILEVYINAPATSSAGRSKTYTMDTGSATLALQVNDAVTGTVLAIVYDRQRSQNPTMQWTTSVTNRAAAASMITGWAEQVKRELDAARAK